MADIYKSAAGGQAVAAFYRRALDRWPVPREEMTIPTCAGDTFVVASGDRGAPPVVLFHGSGTNSAMWIRDVADWSRHHRVYAVDMIGEPGFSAPSRPPLASAAYAAWLDDVWRHLIDALLVVFRHFRPRMARIPIRSDDELATLTMPVQLILGSDDALLQSSETRARMERCVPHLRLSFLEGVGHILPPQTRAISAFLNDGFRDPAVEAYALQK